MDYRPARAIDAPALVDILVERHPDTRYAGAVGIDEPVARKLFAAAVQRHGGAHDGATFLMVAEDRKGIAGFMLASLSRVYMVGDMLASCDHYLIGRKDCPPRVLTRLFDAYFEWAEGNPKVYEVGASWADTIPGGEGFADFFERRGFSLIGQTFSRVVEREQARLAA